jgi:uncharacterized protein YeaO (DUF488 family)
VSVPRLFTSRWQNKALASLDAVPVGISRGTPKFRVAYRYRLLRELAPSREAFGLDDPHEFESAYRAGLDAIGLEAVVERLASVSRQHGGKPLVLLCYEPAHEFCHRHVLRDWLREWGVVIEELKAGDLPRRKDATEPTLF